MQNQIFLICLKISFGQKVKYVYSNHCSSYRKILNKFSNLHILSCVLNFKLKNAYLLEKVWQPPWRTSVGPPRGLPQNPPAPRWSPPPGNAAGRSPWPSLEPTCCQAPWKKTAIQACTKHTSVGFNIALYMHWYKLENIFDIL